MGLTKTEFESKSIVERQAILNSLLMFGQFPDGTSPSIFKTATATTAGDSAVWTPASGKKFKLMAVQFQLTGQAILSVAGNLEVILRDGTTSIGLGLSAFVPAIALNLFGGYCTDWLNLGYGYVSNTTNNVLNVNLNVALLAGEVRVNCSGVEL